MLYLIFNEVVYDLQWYCSFIGIKKISNINKAYTYDSDYYNYYQPIKTFNEKTTYSTFISLIEINDINKYLVIMTNLLQDPSWIKYFKEYLKTQYPELYLLMNIEGI